MLGEIKRVLGRGRPSQDDVLSVWFLWATNLFEDLHHIKRRIGFPPPEEVNGWVALRQLIEKRRRPRAKLRPSELALMIDYGDWLLEQRHVESTNAANVAALLEAAHAFALVHGDPEHWQVRSIYDHIGAEFDVKVPAIHELPKSDRGWCGLDRERLLRVCDALAREEEIIPSWMFHGRAIPPDLRPRPNVPEDTERADPPRTGDLFDDS